MLVTHTVDMDTLKDMAKAAAIMATAPAAGLVIAFVVLTIRFLVAGA